MGIHEQLQVYTAEVEAVLEQYLPAGTGHQQTIFAAMNYSMRAGGKRLRPLLMRETYRLFGGGGPVIEPFMAAVEMIHTSSLIHDDLPCMDHDEMRRGKPTTWVKFGYDMAVLAGDALLIYAVETAAKAFAMCAGGVPGTHADAARIGRGISLLAEKTGIYGMIGGQVADVEMTGRPVSKDKLDFIYRLKTGALLEASMMIGAWLGGANEEQLKTVEQMAACVGLAFQIQDDILDVTGTAEQLGKPVRSDEKNCKTTYVSLEGVEKAREDVKRLSADAIGYLHKLPGENSFLESLLKMLTVRKN